MSKLLMFFLILVPAIAFPCPFEDLQLSELEDLSQFSLGTETAIPFPAALFRSYKRSLSPFSAEECRDSIRVRPVFDRLSAQQFFAVYTNDDSCDGGNTYGLILVSEELKEENVVGVIQDSFIFCQ